MVLNPSAYEPAACGERPTGTVRARWLLSRSGFAPAVSSISASLRLETSHRPNCAISSTCRCGIASNISTGEGSSMAKLGAESVRVPSRLGPVAAAAASCQGHRGSACPLPAPNSETGRGGLLSGASAVLTGAGHGAHMRCPRLEQPPTNTVLFAGIPRSHAQKANRCMG
ncbi:hypothetical protein VTK56DRAFT_5894 [Thermocarpiscus australiensis]